MELKLKVIVVYLFVCTVSCYPSRPLNDRPSELAWQAWLLVDSQNNHGEPDRKITPKSVFIAPNIGDNHSLPDCAEGYRSDPMGRCIKFVKVDEAAHLDFLLQRLNEIYATNPSEELDDDDSKPTSGPLQVNIPLGGGFATDEDFKANPEIAIIVAPTDDDFDEEKLGDDEDVIVNKRTKDKEEELSQTAITSTTMMPMVSTFTAITNTELIETEMSTTTASPSVSNMQAIFFLNSNDSRDAQISHIVNDILSESGNPTATSGTATTESQTTISQQQEMSHTQTESITTSAFNFPTTYDQKDFTDLLQMSTDRNYMTTNNNNPAPFPSSLETVFQPSTDKNYAHVRLASSEIVDLFKDYMQQNPEIVSFSSTDRQVVRRRPVSESTYLEDQITPQIQHPLNLYPPFNHRNRDRNSEFWRSHGEETLPKPLVVRFERQQMPSAPGSNMRFINSERLFLNPDSFSDESGRKRRRGNIR